MGPMKTENCELRPQVDVLGVKIIGRKMRTGSTGFRPHGDVLDVAFIGRRMRTGSGESRPKAGFFYSPKMWQLKGVG